MRVTHVGHAAILVESRGLRILSDPWWEGPCFGTQWWIHPRPALDAVNAAPVDYVYISHGHHDHLHLGTLRRVPGNPKLLVSGEIDIASSLRAQGFEVVEIARDRPVEFEGGLKADLRPTYNGDTLLVLSDGSESCANLNDAVHSLTGHERRGVVAALKRDYPQLSYVFCGYGMASYFPGCFNAPGVDREATVAKRQAHFNGIWAEIIAELGPRFGFPFAADVAFLEEEALWMNPVMHNSERPTDRFARAYPDHPTRVIDIAPGFVIEDGQVVVDRRFEPVSEERLREEMREGIAVCARTPKVPEGGLAGLLEMISVRIASIQPYLREYDGDYRIAVEIAEADETILIEKRGGTVAARLAPADAAGPRDLTFRTKFAYLRRTLTDPYGHEVLFVGSGCRVDYSDAALLSAELHRELLAILKYGGTPPASRFGDQPRWLYNLKQTVKRAAGREEDDPYALERWLVTERA